MKNNRYLNYDREFNQNQNLNFMYQNNLNNLNNNFIYSPIKQTNSSKIDLSISYKNYEIDRAYRKNLSSSYGKDLQDQIREREMRKLEEKRKKQQEELLEEQRLYQERNFLEAKNRDEERRRREEIEKYKLDNERIMNSYMVMSRPKILKKEENVIIDKETEEERRRRLLEQRKKEMQFFNENIKNSLEKIKNDMLNQQNVILKEVNKLRDQNLHSNLYKVDITKSLSNLREELKRKKFQEDIQKDYLYSSLVETKFKQNKLNNQFNRLAGIEKFPDLYINKSQNLLDLRDHQNSYSTENKYFIDPEVISDKINREYEKDKFNLNYIFLKNEKRLQILNKKFRIIE
jgi:hypothetical protein